MEDEALDIGTADRRFISGIVEECDPALVHNFHYDVRMAYVAVVKKLIDHFFSKVKY